MISKFKKLYQLTIVYSAKLAALNSDKTKYDAFRIKRN